MILVGTLPLVVVVFEAFFSSAPFNLTSVSFASFPGSATLAVGGGDLSVLLTIGMSSTFFADSKTVGFFSVIFSAVTMAAGPTLIGNSPFCDIEVGVGPTGMKFDLTRVIGVTPFPAVDVGPSRLLPGGVEVALLFCCSKKARKEETCA